MAEFLAAKTSAEVVQRRWTVPCDSDDGAQSVATSASGVTVDEDSLEGNDVVLTLSAGAAAATGAITVTVTTSRGRTLIETLYIPIVQSAAQIAATARDYCSFALRKIVGIGETPSADEMDHAIDCLNALVATWREGGADIGAAFPIDENTIIYCPDWSVSALRYNLMQAVCPLFGAEMAPQDVLAARSGLALIKQRNVPDDRPADYY